MLISYKSLLIAVLAVSYAAASPQDDGDLDVQATCDNNGDKEDDGRRCQFNTGPLFDFGSCVGTTCTLCSDDVACLDNANPFQPDYSCYNPANSGVFALDSYCLRKCDDNDDCGGGGNPPQNVCGSTLNPAHQAVCFRTDAGCNGGGNNEGRPCVTDSGVEGTCHKPEQQGDEGFCRTSIPTPPASSAPPPAASSSAGTPPASSASSTAPTPTAIPCNPYGYDSCPAGNYCKKSTRTCKPGCKKQGSNCTKDGKSGKCRANHTCDVSAKKKGSNCSTKKNNDCGSGLKCVAKYGYKGRCHPVAGANQSCGAGTYYAVCGSGYKCKNRKCKRY